MIGRRNATLAAWLLAAASGTALAQNAPTFDPAQLPAISGKVLQYTLTPRGDVDGFILQGGVQVHLPPHLSTQLVYAVKPGDSVTVHGLKALAVPMVEAMSVRNDATGQTVVDTGPPGPRRHGEAAERLLTAQGRIGMQLHGPRGELNGVVLQNGTIVHLPPPEAARLSDELQPGQPLYAQGAGISGPLGTVIDAESLGPSQTQATDVALPPPPRGHRHRERADAFAPPPRP